MWTGVNRDHDMVATSISRAMRQTRDPTGKSEGVVRRRLLDTLSKWGCTTGRAAKPRYHHLRVLLDYWGGSTVWR
jgi:hypothetical protein